VNSLTRRWAPTVRCLRTWKWPLRLNLFGVFRKRFGGVRVDFLLYSDDHCILATLYLGLQNRFGSSSSLEEVRISNFPVAIPSWENGL